MRYIFLFVFFIFCFNIYAQNEKKIIIRNINFIQPKRTKIRTLENLIYPFKTGSVYTEKTKNEILEKLYTAGILRPEIQYEENFENDYVDITITALDKWTFIPFINFSFSSTSWFIGLGFFETNLFGFNKKLAISGKYGTQGWIVNTSYMDPRFFTDKLSLNAYLSAGEKSMKDFNISTKKYIREYKNLYVMFSIKSGYKIMNDFILSAGIRYEQNSNIKNKLSKVNNIMTIGIIYGLEYKKTKYLYPFTQGIKINLDNSYNIGVAPGSHNYYQSEFAFNGALVFKKRNRVGFVLKSGFGDADAQREFRLGGYEGSFILPNEIIAADYYSSLFVFYELFMFDIKWKTKSIVAFAIQPFYEVGVFKNEISQQTFYHGPGISLLIYPSIINLQTPSIGFRCGWDLQNKSFNFIISASKSI